MTASNRPATTTRQLERLNAHFGNSLWDWELGTHTEWYSTKLVSLLDYEIDDKDTRFPNELIRLLAQSAPSTQLAAQRIQHQLAQCENFDERLNIHTPDGETIWLRIRGAVSNEGNEGPYSAGVIEDITDRIILENERSRFSDELARSNAELEAFANIASHDLRAPLRHIQELANSLSSNAQPLPTQTHPLSPAQEKAVEEIKLRAGLMDNLLTGLLDYARIGRAQDRAEAIDWDQLATDALALLAPPEHCRLELVCTAGTIIADVTLVQTCLRNLLDNAFKHANRHSPYVKLVISPVPCAADSVQLEVHDNGPGIPEQKRSAVFELFQTLEQAETTKGSGMGLAIVKKSIDALGGTVAVASSPLGGARMTLIVPGAGTLKP